MYVWMNVYELVESSSKFLQNSVKIWRNIQIIAFDSNF